jgi:hypothetical protein
VGVTFWTQTLGIISNVVTETNESLAICDFAGKTNSQNIILTKPTESTAAHKCAAYSTEGFGAGSWFLPSCGQWNVARLNKTIIDNSIGIAGGAIIGSRIFWTSTQYNEQVAWSAYWANSAPSGYTKTNPCESRPFCTYEYNPVPNGVYIYDKDNNRYTKEEWASSGKGISDVCGIGISTDTDSFMVSTAISAQSYPFGGGDTLIPNVPLLSSGIPISNLSKATHGFIYTDVIISALGIDNALAAKYAKTYAFGNGQSGYLPSFGEVNILYSYRTQVEEILRTLGLSLWGSQHIQTCTQFGPTNNAALYWQDGKSLQPVKNSSFKVLPFTFLPFQGSTEEGIYILDTDNSLITRSNWSIENNNKAVGVVVLLSKCQFVIAPTGSSSTQI